MAVYPGWSGSTLSLMISICCVRGNLYNLLVNLIRLNEQQANLLGDPTAEEYQAPPGSYVGVLEVFHQLHCLVSSFISAI